MRSDQDTIMERMTRWAEGLEQFDLPDWDSLPQLDLYMDQVILLLTRYLTPIDRDAEEKFVTASIINNYVRMRVIPPPVKKRYSRIHLAYLVVICTLKQSLSISCIQRLLPEDRSEEAVRQFYDGFVRQYRRSTAFLRRLLLTGGVPALAEAAWTERLDYGDFLSRLEPRPGWTPRTDWDPAGPEARRTAAAYLRTFRRENGGPGWPGLPMAWRFMTRFGARTIL